MSDQVPLRIHAICLVLNEELFIENQLTNLYPLCSGISILTQYDRDWYGNRVIPDKTFDIIRNFPDPEGKIHLVVRRWKDQAAAYNCEMAALSSNPHRRVIPHGQSFEIIRNFHATPDYFLIVDVDEFYDPETFPDMIRFLTEKRSRGMRVWGLNYLHDWKTYLPREVVPFKQFGFIRPGLDFESLRVHRWNESRLAKGLKILRLPDFSAAVYGFIDCPFELGHFHHGCWLGSNERLQAKANKSTHRHEMDLKNYLNEIEGLKSKSVSVDRAKIPSFLSRLSWPEDLL